MQGDLATLPPRKQLRMWRSQRPCGVELTPASATPRRMQSRTVAEVSSPSAKGLFARERTPHVSDYTTEKFSKTLGDSSLSSRLKSARQRSLV